MVDNLWSLASELFDKTEIFVFTDWGTTKTLQAMAALLSIATGSYGVYKAYHFAESRLANRLLEFLQREEARLSDARQKIMAAQARQPPATTHVKQIFANRPLSDGLMQMGFGKKEKAEHALEEALKLIEERVHAASRWQSAQMRQKSAALLLLGAIADAKGHHGSALEHFEEALNVNPEDLEARKYAGQQLLKNANPQQALQYFVEVEKKARSLSDMQLVCESLLLQARAYCALPAPQYWKANATLLSVVKEFAKGISPLDKAEMHEFHGFIRQNLGTQNALGSYQAAKNIYVTLIEHGGAFYYEAKAGYARVSEKVEQINRESQGDVVEEELAEQAVTSPVEA